MLIFSPSKIPTVFIAAEFVAFWIFLLLLFAFLLFLSVYSTRVWLCQRYCDSACFEGECVASSAWRKSWIHRSVWKFTLLVAGLFYCKWAPPHSTRFPTRGFSLSFSLADRLDLGICYFWNGGLMLCHKDAEGPEVLLRRRDLYSNNIFFSPRARCLTSGRGVYGSP